MIPRTLPPPGHPRQTSRRQMRAPQRNRIPRRRRNDLTRRPMRTQQARSPRDGQHGHVSPVEHARCDAMLWKEPPVETADGTTLSASSKRVADESEHREYPSPLLSLVSFQKLQLRHLHMKDRRLPQNVSGINFRYQTVTDTCIPAERTFLRRHHQRPWGTWPVPRHLEPKASAPIQSALPVQMSAGRAMFLQSR